MGLTGVQATSSVNAAGLILKYYGKLDPKTSTGYTTKNQPKKQAQDILLKLLHNYV